MKVVIFGSRDITDYEYTKKCIAHAESLGLEITEVVSGMAPGVDSLGVQYAKEKGLPLKEFWAKWKEEGKAAGPIRNKKMADYADCGIGISKNDSRGTKDMKNQLDLLNKDCYFYEYKN